MMKHLIWILGGIALTGCGEAFCDQQRECCAAIESIPGIPDCDIEEEDSACQAALTAIRGQLNAISQDIPNSCQE